MGGYAALAVVRAERGNDREEGGEAVNEKPTPEGRQLFQLFGICLGASISLLPASFISVLPKANSAWFTATELGFLWFYLGLFLMLEYWKAARLNWLHEMDFKWSFGWFAYLAMNSSYVLLLVMLPATVALYGFVEAPSSPNKSLGTLIAALVLMKVLSIGATVVKFSNAELMGTSRISNSRRREAVVSIAGDLFLVLLYALWVPLTAQKDAIWCIFGLYVILILDIVAIFLAKWLFSGIAERE